MITITCSNDRSELLPFRMYEGMYSMLAYLNGLRDPDYRICDHQFGIAFRVLADAEREMHLIEVVPETTEQLDCLERAFQFYRREARNPTERVNDLALATALRGARIAGSDYHLALSYGAEHVVPHLDDYAASSKVGKFSDLFLGELTRSQRHPTLMAPAMR